jgi:hypothetical protein
MTKQVSAEELQKTMDSIMKLVSRLPSPRKEKVREMLDGPVGEQYFLAPASSREDYHNCFPGGLAAHSLSVVNNLKRISDVLAPDQYSNSTIIFVGLFHDLGKVGDGVVPNYVPNPNEYGRRRGFLYEINKECAYAPNAERGLYLLQKHGIEVSMEEWAAIRVSDGQYVEENRSFAMREPDLGILLHFADLWTTRREKTSNETDPNVDHS